MLTIEYRFHVIGGMVCLERRFVPDPANFTRIDRERTTLSNASTGDWSNYLMSCVTSPLQRYFLAVSGFR
jgi:hypothetical protein